MATRQSWIIEQVNSAKFSGIDSMGILAYLNAPDLVEIPGTGTVPVVLGIEEVGNGIPFLEWEKIAEADRKWKDAAKIAGQNVDAQPAIKAIDAMLNRTAGTSDVRLELAVMTVIQASEKMRDAGNVATGAQIAGGLILVLASAGLLSPETVGELEIITKTAAPSTWEVGQSVAERALGSRVTESEILTAIGGAADGDVVI